MPDLMLKPLPAMEERLRFSTSVETAYSAEMRTVRRAPRCGLSYAFRATDARFAAFEEVLKANLTADWTVPLWHERTRGLTLSMGQTVISCSTDADWRAASFAMIWKGCEEYETATVLTVGSGQITLSAGLAAAYAGAAIMPAHAGFISGPPRYTRGSRGLMDLGLEIMLRAPADLSASVWGTYGGYEILGCASAYLSRLSGGIAINVDYVDDDIAPEVLEAVRASFDQLYAVELAGHAWDIKRFLHQVRGRSNAFWVRSWGGAQTVQAAAAASSTIVVTATRPAADLVDRHVVIDGIYRQINSVVDNGATYTLTLSSALGADVAAGAPASLLSLVRLEDDAVDIHHQHGFSSRVSFPVIEVAA